MSGIRTFIDINTGFCSTFPYLVIESKSSTTSFENFGCKTEENTAYLELQIGFSWVPFGNGKELSHVLFFKFHTVPTPFSEKIVR
jgi:hypothetical protein